MSCATVSCIRSLNMRRHTEAAGSLFVLQSKKLVLEYAYCQMIPEGVCSTLCVFSGPFFRTFIQYQLLYTPLSRITKHPVIGGLGKGGGGSQWRTVLVFPVKWCSGYMTFNCITAVYSDNSTTPTDNTALLRIRGITEGNSTGRRV